MHNKAQQFAADGRRTPFTWLLRRHSKAAAVLRRYVPPPKHLALRQAKSYSLMYT